jgi:hypothetical protein
MPWAAQLASGFGLANEGLLPCFFKTYTGLPCLLCGGTHAVMHLLSFELSQAFSDNAAVTLISLSLLAYGLVLLLESISGRRFFLLDQAKKINPWLFRTSALALLGNWAFVLKPLLLI